MGSDPNAYSTDYDNFSCDHGTGMETQAKYADSIYTHDERRLLVNLFIPSEVHWQERGITWRQSTRLPDSSSTVLTVTSGAAKHELLVRVPGWASGARVRLNGRTLPDRPVAGSWLSLERTWRTGDRVEVTLPMRTTVEATPDDPDVKAVLHGPVVLAGAHGDTASRWMPRLDTTTIRKASADPLRLTATADGQAVNLLPIARVHHQYYDVYWLTGQPRRRPRSSPPGTASTRPPAARPPTPPATAGRRPWRVGPPGPRDASAEPWPSTARTDMSRSPRTCWPGRRPTRWPPGST
jgi:hypothetical protein